MHFIIIVIAPRTLRHKRLSVSVTSAFYRTGTLVLCLIPQSRGLRDHRLDLISTLINLFSMGSPTRSAGPQLIKVNGSRIQCTCKPPHHINPLNLEIKIKILICHPYSFSEEKLIKYQANSFCVIMSVILITTLFYKALPLQGKICY